MTKKIIFLIAVLTAVTIGVVLFQRNSNSQQDTSNQVTVESNSCEQYEEGGYIAEHIGGPLESLNDLVDQADSIVVAEVVDCGPNPSELSADFHNVDFSFSVTEVIKGDADTGLLPVSMMIEVDENSIAYLESRTPKLSAGQKVTLFLTEENNEYQMFRSGNTVAFNTSNNTFTFSDVSGLPIQQTFELSELK